MSLLPLNLGRLERIEIKKVWSHEALIFTPWLAQEENLKLLGEAIGMDLVLEAQEKSVGPFRADLVCKEAFGDRWVLIENQIERTDHPHLGQLLTYAAGLHATTMVWVAAKFTDEHRAALDWLNEITNDSAAFFGLEIEAWRIGDSAPAPKFNVVSRPNAWVKPPQPPQNGGFTSYWEAFNTYLEDHGKPLTPKKPGPDIWMAWGVGRAAVSLAAIVSRPQRKIGARISLEDPSAKAYFTLLEKHRPEIDAKLPNLQWDLRSDKVQSYIGVYLDDADPDDAVDWPRQYGWLVENLLAIRDAFAVPIQSLPSGGKLPGPEPDDRADPADEPSEFSEGWSENDRTVPRETLSPDRWADDRDEAR